MPKIHHILLFYLLHFYFLALPSYASPDKGEPVRTDNYSITEVNGQFVPKRADNQKQFSKITPLSLYIIGVFLLLTIVLLVIIKYRAKVNKMLVEKNEELQLAKEKAEKANLAKAQFLSTVTHELRTPLYTVTGLTHLLLKENPTPEQKEHLNSLRFSGEYLLSLINNILDLNKLEAKKVIIEAVPFNLRKRVSDVLIALKKPAASHNNKLNFLFDHSIPNRVISDPLKISQILINLIGNSIKFTRDGEINVRVKKIKDIDEDNIRLLFEIEDNGSGISEENLEKIFDSFSQETLQINGTFGGTGLGLSIVKNLLQLMKSKIQLTSEKNKGSNFFFELDFKIPKKLEDSPKNKILNGINFQAMKGKKVLVVEDNKTNQFITCKILDKQGIMSDIADDGETAVIMAKSNTYDLILMDIHMPGISGLEASRQIREFDTNIPIVALTAVTLSDHMEEFSTNGINDVIPKPYKIEDFFVIIEKAFNKEFS